MKRRRSRSTAAASLLRAAAKSILQQQQQQQRHWQHVGNKAQRAYMDEQLPCRLVLGAGLAHLSERNLPGVSLFWAVCAELEKITAVHA
jgi:hypothetical protein